MYKILIIDDEQLIVEGLKVFLPWEDFGFEIIGEAYDGKEGVKKAIALRPDVIITDIRMPLLSGHEVIAAIKPYLPDCIFIVLSGYREFEYAQQALNLGSFCYLLKPVQEDELKKKLLEIKAVFEKRQERETKLEALRNQIQDDFPIVKDKFLYDIILGTTAITAKTMQKWDYFHLPQPLKRACVMLLEIDNLADKNSVEEVLLLKFAVRNIVQEVVSQMGNNIAFPYTQDRLAVLCCEAGDKQISLRGIKELADKLGYLIKKHLKRTVSIGIGQIYDSLELLRQSSCEAELALGYKLIYGENSMIAFDQIPHSEEEDNFPAELERELILAVELGDAESAYTALHKIFTCLSCWKSKSSQVIYNMFLNLVIVVTRCATACGVPNWKFIDEKHSFLQDALALDTLQKLENYLTSFVQEAVEQVQEQRTKKSKTVLDQIKDYMEKHYQEDISLDFFAKKFFLNSCYLSQLFHKEMGVNFMSFLTDIRIREAKKLLLNPNLKIYEVGNMVGYNSQRYFSQIFERHVGCSPSKYRSGLFDNVPSGYLKNHPNKL